MKKSLSSFITKKIFVIFFIILWFYIFSNLAIATTPITIKIYTKNPNDYYITWEENKGSFSPVQQISTLRPDGLNTYIVRSSVTSFISGRIYIGYKNKPNTGNSGIIDPKDNPNTRFDWVELTYTGDINDKANLTAVNQLGIPMKLETQDNSGNTIQSIGYKDSFNTLINKLKTKNSKAFVYGSSGEFIRVLAPNTDNIQGKSWSTINNYNNYLNTIKSKTITIKGSYYGDPVQHYPAVDYDYNATFASNILTLTENSGSHTKGTIKLDVAKLPDAITNCDIDFTVSGGNQKPGAGTQKVGTNSVYSAIIRDFFVGFNVGFYGCTKLPSGCYDSSKWLSTASNGERVPIPGTIFNNSSGDYNYYAKIVNQSTNAYSFPFQDYLGSVFVSLYADPSKPRKVETLLITILEDTETGGFTPTPSPASTGPVPDTACPDPCNPNVNSCTCCSKANPCPVPGTKITRDCSLCTKRGKYTPPTDVSCYCPGTAKCDTSPCPSPLTCNPNDKRCY